jgi:hypothetical protein
VASREILRCAEAGKGQRLDLLMDKGKVKQKK